VRITTAFAAAFVMGAVVIFTIVHATATVLGVTQLPFHWRVVFAGGGLLTLAVVDLRTLMRSTYCPISLRRQTPRILMSKYRIDVVASIWGFDTGLVITTFRVAAISWSALFLTALGLSSPWVGIVYGLGFCLPFLILLFRPQVGRASRAAALANPGLEAMLRKRSLMQSVSAVLLVASGGTLLARFIA
jgi:hypothetical protein